MKDLYIQAEALVDKIDDELVDESDKTLGVSSITAKSRNANDFKRPGLATHSVASRSARQRSKNESNQN